MGLVRNEILIHPSKVRNQTTTDGGRMDWKTNLTLTGVVGQLISAITESERASGVTRHYKIFAHAADSENTPYGSYSTFLAETLTGDFVMSTRAATQVDTWATAASQRNYGAGKLATNVSAGGQTIVINTRGASYNHFQNGDTIVIHNKANLDDGTGTLERKTIDQAPSWNGDEVTIHISEQLSNNYNTSRTLSGVTVYTYIASMSAPADVKGVVTSQNNTSASGTINTANITVPSQGAVRQTITLTFTSSSAFTATSDDGDVTLGSGNISTVFSPNNPTYSSPYIYIPPAAWGGAWITGDSVQLVVSPAAAPLWLVLHVPAGSNPYTGYPKIWGYGYSGIA